MHFNCKCLQVRRLALQSGEGGKGLVSKRGGGGGGGGGEGERRDGVVCGVD